MDAATHWFDSFHNARTLWHAQHRVNSPAEPSDEDVSLTDVRERRAVIQKHINPTNWHKGVLDGKVKQLNVSASDVFTSYYRAPTVQAVRKAAFTNSRVKWCWP